MTSTHAPTEEKEAEGEFYSSLDKVCGAVPNSDMKTALGDSTIKLEKESCLYPACGGLSLHNETYDNGERMVGFALGRDLSVTGTWYQHKDIHKVT